MSRILTQEELDALLAPTAPDRAAGQTGAPGASDAVAYNFRRPDRLSKEQLRSLHLLHDRFALNVSTSLSAFLRAVTEVSIVSVEQFAYSEFLLTLPDSTAFYAVGLHPLEGLAALEMNPAVAYTMVDRLLGGTGQTPPPARALTEIEQNVVDAVVRLLLEALGDTWKPIFDVQFRIHGRDTQPQMLQVTGPNEVVVGVMFDIRIGDVRGMLNLCIPASAIESVGDRFAQGWQRTRRGPTAQEQGWLHANLAQVPLPVTTLIESTLSARELLALERGDVLVLNHAAAEPLNVHVAAVPRFAGHLRREGHGVGLLITRVEAPVVEFDQQVEGAA